MEPVDLLQNRHILPAKAIVPPKVKLQTELWNNMNCSPDIFRSTLTKVPETESILKKCRLPMGILVSTHIWPHSVEISPPLCHSDFTWNPFRLFRSSKNCRYFAILWICWFGGFQPSKSAKIHENHFIAFKYVQKLISRKIWVIEKFCVT